LRKQHKTVAEKAGIMEPEKWGDDSDAGSELKGGN
jgi:hypothetical protein